MLVGRLRLGQLARAIVDVGVALAGTVDAIGPVQAGVEPLRRVRRAPSAWRACSGARRRTRGRPPRW